MLCVTATANGGVTAHAWCSLFTSVRVLGTAEYTCSAVLRAPIVASGESHTCTAISPYAVAVAQSRTGGSGDPFFQDRCGSQRPTRRFQESWQVWFIVYRKLLCSQLFESNNVLIIVFLWSLWSFSSTLITMAQENPDIRKDCHRRLNNELISAAI